MAKKGKGRRVKRRTRTQEPWYGRYVGSAVIGVLGVVLIIIPEPTTSLLGLLMVSGAATTAGVKVANDNTPRT